MDSLKVWFAALVSASLIVCNVAYAGATNSQLKEITMLSEQGNQAAALDKVDAYLKQNPGDAEAMFMKGVIQVELGKRNAAIATFTTITNRFPNLPEPYNNLAVLYADQGQYDKARNALERAIKTHPSYATAHENLGDIYARLASQAYNKAFKLDANNARAQNKLSMITDLFGDKRTVVAAADPVVKSAKIEPPVKVAVAPKPVPKPVVVPDPVVEPTPVVKPVVASTDAKSDIIGAVNAWASAWSNKDVSGYLASYASDFKTPKGESRSAWEKVRSSRVGKPGTIKVTVNEPKVTMNGENKAKVTFYQAYRSNGKSLGTGKTLKMVNEGGAWLIQQEKSGR